MNNTKDTIDGVSTVIDRHSRTVAGGRASQTHLRSIAMTNPAHTVRWQTEPETPLSNHNERFVTFLIYNTDLVLLFWRSGGR